MNAPTGARDPVSFHTLSSAPIYIRGFLSVHTEEPDNPHAHEEQQVGGINRAPRPHDHAASLCFGGE